MNEPSSTEAGTGPRCPFCNSPAAVNETLPADLHCSACGGSFRLAPSDVATVDEVQELGRFRLLERVGRGSFGVVWRARDTALDRVVAVKVPHPSYLDNASMRERFRREARAAAQLRHPGIVTVHEVLDVHGLLVIVSEFIAGATLKELLEQRRLTFRESASLVAEVAGALDYAHSRGLVHRDIKPANVLIELAIPGPAAPAERPIAAIGKPLVADFGLALRDEAEIVMTVDGQLVGTPAYMSPEQAAGKGHRADRRSDVYSLGVMLYEMLTGELPFRGSRAMLVHQVISEQPRPPRRINDRIPRDLETICLKAMAKEPSWRYATADELAGDLQRYLRGEPVRARPIGPMKRSWLWCRRNKALASAIALAITALVSFVMLAIAFGIREWQNARELAGALDRANSERRQAEYRHAESLLNRGLAACEQNDAGQGMLWLARALKTTPPEAVELNAYLRLSLGSWQSRQCPLEACLDHPGTIQAAAFGPDDRSFVTLAADGSWHLWDRPGAWTKSRSGRIAAPFRQAALGQSAAVTGDIDGTVRRWALPSFEPLGPPLKHSAPVAALAVSPDGRAFVAGGGEEALTCWKHEPAGLRTVRLTSGTRTRCVAVSPDGKWVAAGGGDKFVRVWDTASGMLLHTFAHDALADGLAFGNSGVLLATGCMDGSVRLWDVATGKALPFQVRHAGVVNTVAIRSDGGTIVSGSDDNSARVWSVRTRQLISSPLVHAGAVTVLALSVDGKRILTGGADHAVRLWSVPPRQEVMLETAEQGSVRGIAFSPDGKLVLTGEGKLGKSGAGRLWDAHSGRLLGTPLVHTDLVVAAAFNHDGSTIVTAGLDGAARLADVKTGERGPVLLHGAPIHAAAFSPSGDLVLTGGKDGSAQLWDVKTGNPIGTRLIHEQAVMTVAFDPEGKLFFTGGYDGRLCLWRTAGQSPLVSCSLGEPILAAEFSHDGKRIVLAAGKSARVFDVSSGKILDPPLDHRAMVRGVAFSPDDRLILTTSDDRTAQLWNTASRTSKGFALTHGMTVLGGVFSPDGRLVLTRSADGTARLWDVATGRRIGPSLNHPGSVWAAAFSRDGKHFATGSSIRAAWLRQTPQPWEGEPVQITRRAEVFTGMELDRNERLEALDPAAWQERRAASMTETAGGRSP